MADNLSINITADTTSLRAQLAIAQADIRAYGAEVRKLASELRGAGDDAKGGLQASLQASAGHLAQAEAAAAGFRKELSQHKHVASEAGEAVGLIRENVLELASAFGVGFSIEKLIEGVKHLAEMGEEAVHSAAAVGMAVDKYSELDVALQLTGSSAGAADRTIRLLEKSINTAVESPGSPKHDQFKNLGISDEDLKAGQRDIGAFIRGPLAESFEKFGGSPQGIGIFSQLLGRSVKELIPLLENGAAGLAKLLEEAHKTGAVLDKETARALEETAKGINTLSKSLDGLGIRIYKELKDPIDASVKSLTDLAQATSAKTGVGAVAGGAAGTFVGSVIGGAVGSAGGPVGTILGGGAGAAAGGLIGAGIGGAIGTADQIVSGDSQEGKLIPFPTHKSASENFEHFNFGNIKAPGGKGWNEYPNAESGVAAIERWLIRAQEQHGTDTLGKIIERYAPASDNPGKDLIGDAARRTGLGPDQKIDVHDEAIRKKITEAILKQEEAPKVAFDVLNAPPGTAVEAEGKQQPGNYSTTEAKKALDQHLKQIDDLIKYDEDYYAKKIALAHNNDGEIRRLEDERDKKLKTDLAEWVTINAAADKLIQSDPAGKEHSLRTLDIDVIKRRQKADEDAARLDIGKLETQRKIADAQEQTDLQRVEGQRRTGDLTIDAASDAEQKIVQDHAAAVDKILAKEAERAQVSIRLTQEVANRQDEIEAKNAEKITQIQDKAKEEHAARAHAVDAELAGAASGLIVNLATGKGGGIEKQLASFAEGQAKKGLDFVFTKLLDASGVGKTFEKIGDKITGTLFDKGVDKVADKVVDKGVDKVVDKGVDAVTNTATQTAPVIGAITAQTAALTASQATSTTAIVGAIYGSGALVFSKPEVLGTSLLGGGVIPSAAGGMTVNDGKGGTIAIVHPNEMVLPAPLSLGIQNAISRGAGWSIPAAPAPNTVSPAMAGGGQGGDTHITHNWDIDGVLSTHDFQRLLMKHSDTIAKAGARATRDFSGHAPPR